MSAYIVATANAKGSIMQNNDEQLELLRTAITNVGYWSWWTAEEHTQSIQLEFGGVQLFIPPLTQNEAPSNQIALRFISPSSIQFFNTVPMADDWPEQLANDELDPFVLDAEKFVLSTSLDLPEFLNDVNITRELHPNDVKPHYQLAFLAGDIGFRVTAKDIRIYCHQGQILLPQVNQLNEKWWRYREAYVASKNSDQPMPEDYACEVGSVQE